MQHLGSTGLERHRKDARALVRAARAGESAALARATAVLGDRASRRFRLSDAQHVIAVERGYRSWPLLRQAVESAQPRDRLVESGLRYAGGEPVRVLVRKRGRRYDIDDDADGVRLAGRPRGWFELAERVAEEHALNVNRRGAVFVTVVEGRDIAALAKRVADCSYAVHAALLELAADEVG